MRCVDDNPSYLDKRQVRAAFERSAAHYDAVATLQRTVGERLLAHLDPVRVHPALVVDVGAGTGICLRQLERRYQSARIMALDLVEQMLRQARRKTSWFRSRQCFVCGDAEQLPLRSRSVDLLFSNLTLQWCNDSVETYREFARVLNPGGLLVFSTFGRDTLTELRASFSLVDGYSHVNAFLDLHDIGDGLLAAGFNGVVVDAERITCTYQDVFSLMKDLKLLGAHNMTSGRHRGLTGKQRMQAMARAYETYRRDGVLPATYEVVYAHGWLPEPNRTALPVMDLHWIPPH